ncbi:MAG: hypothetical protein ACREV9_13360, partial [Burkholderiales bacterium]
MVGRIFERLLNQFLRERTFAFAAPPRFGRQVGYEPALQLNIQSAAAHMASLLSEKNFTTARKTEITAITLACLKPRLLARLALI